MRKKGKGSMFTTAISAIAIADIIVIVVLALGFLIGLIGGSKKAFKGIFATLGIIMLSLLIVSVSVNPIVGLAGGSLTSTFKEKAAGWGTAFTTEIYIAKADDGAPLKDGDHYVYYINVVGEDGAKEQVMLEDAMGKGLVDKAKAKFAVMLAKRFIKPAVKDDPATPDKDETFEGTEGQSLADYAAEALTALIFDVILFVVYCIVLGLIFFLCRKLLKHLRESESAGLRVLDRVIGMIVATALAMLTLLLVFAIIRAAAPAGSKVDVFFTSSGFAGLLYSNNPMYGFLMKIFG